MADAIRIPGAADGDVTHAPGYLRHLLFFVCFCTMFEGYDILIVSLSLPHIGKEFNAGSDLLGYTVGLISIGTVLAFALVGLADRYGRRAIFLTAVSGYTIFTVLTAFSTSLYDFAAYQFIARLFMVTEIGVAAIILTEEMPARYRGVGVTLVFGLAIIGGIAGAMIYPLVIKSEFGWRGLYFLGGAVLPVLLIYWRRLQETQRWQRNQRPAGERRPSILASYGEMLTIFKPEYRRRLFAGTSIWFAVNAWSASTLFFFTYYVINERGWDASLVGSTLSAGFIFAILGNILAGPMIDFAGRRFTLCTYFAVASLSTMTCFLTQSQIIIMVSYCILMMTQAMWGISATITSEIFPTELRATGNAVVNNLLGRIGMVLAPPAVGVLSVWLGSVGTAVAVLAVAPFLAIPVILLLLSEAKGKTLEEVAS
ncbi:MAG TPA: MFS transporter [Alphaproteobacteria bacterium]|nr:MFS transporter [Alphaproteobacteria bacterium]